jgi:hypothetical protein
MAVRILVSVLASQDSNGSLRHETVASFMRSFVFWITAVA